MIRNPPCDMKTRIIQLYYQYNLRRFWNMIVIFQSARGCCACETNCNALYYAMPMDTTHIVVNQAWIFFKTKIDCNIMKDIKRTIFQAFSPAFSKLLL